LVTPAIGLVSGALCILWGNIREKPVGAFGVELGPRIRPVIGRSRRRAESDKCPSVNDLQRTCRRRVGGRGAGTIGAARRRGGSGGGNNCRGTWRQSQDRTRRRPRRYAQRQHREDRQFRAELNEPREATEGFRSRRARRAHGVPAGETGGDTGGPSGAAGAAAASAGDGSGQTVAAAPPTAAASRNRTSTMRRRRERASRRRYQSGRNSGSLTTGIPSCFGRRGAALFIWRLSDPGGESFCGAPGSLRALPRLAATRSGARSYAEERAPLRVAVNPGRSVPRVYNNEGHSADCVVASAVASTDTLATGIAKPSAPAQVPSSLGGRFPPNSSNTDWVSIGRPVAFWRSDRSWGLDDSKPRRRTDAGSSRRNVTAW